MHNFNLGFGGDLCASGLFTLCELKIFPGRKLQAWLDFAHDRFESWCGEHRKTPQVKSFDKKKFKYKTCLVLSFSIKPFLHINMDIIYPPRPVLVFCGPGPLEPLRKKTFPQGTGRALLCKWLDWELDQLDLGDYDPWVVEKIQVVPCTILEFWISLKFGIPSLNIITVRPIYGIYIYIYQHSTNYNDIYNARCTFFRIHPDAPKEVDDAQLLELLGWTLRNINSFFSLVHKQGIFMTREAAMPIVEHGFNAADISLQKDWSYLFWVFGGNKKMHLEENDTCFSKPGFPKEGFAGLASFCTQRRLALFRLRPKLHLFTHTPNLDKK